MLVDYARPAVIKYLAHSWVRLSATMASGTMHREGQESSAVSELGILKGRTTWDDASFLSKSDSTCQNELTRISTRSNVLEQLTHNIPRSCFRCPVKLDIHPLEALSADG
jgi:hypothetical protein